MKKKNNILKEAVVLLIAATMIFSAGFSAAAAMTNTNEENTEFKIGEELTLQSDNSELVKESTEPSPLERADFLGYDDGTTENAYAWTSGNPWQEAIQLTDAQLAGYRDGQITEAKFSCGCDDYGFYVADYEIWISDILEDPNAPPVVYKSGTSSGTGWDIVTLDMPYDIPDTGDVYLGISYSNYGGNWPAGVDDSTYVPEGLWLYYSGAWVDGTSVGLGPYVWGLDAGVETLPAHSIDVEKQVYVPGEPIPYPAEYQIFLIDSWGDGWNGGFIDVYLNGGYYDTYTLDSGSGPEYHPITVNANDLIEFDYTAGSYAYENNFGLMDDEGVILVEAWGDDPDPDIDYLCPEFTLGVWMDADTAEEAIDMEIYTTIEFQIIIHNDGDFPLFDIYLDDYWDESLVFEYAEPMPMEIVPGYAWWWFDYVLYPCETITVHVWMHVVGPHCSIDENLAIATASYEEGGMGERITFSNTDSIETANTENTQQLELTLTDEGSTPGQCKGATRDVVWDNGMDYTGLGASQFEEEDPGFNVILADDFQFGVDQEVNDVHWVGGYWQTGYPDAHWPWEIIFWYDDGTGNAPGDMMDSFYYDVGEYTETFIEDTGTKITYEFSVDLPYSIIFTEGEKYWISIWGYGVAFPQSGWAMHDDPITLHMGLLKSAYFGFPDWTDSINVFGTAYDYCFQLTYQGEPEYVTDEDSAFIHARDPAHIDVEKYVGVIGEPCDYTLCLEDTFGDGWNGGYLDVYINGVFYATYTLEGAGPECHAIPVAHGDEIFVDYTPGGWSYENIWYLIDCDGNELWRQEGSDDPDAHDMTTTVELILWFDADTEAEAIDQFICEVIPFKITIHNDGFYPLFDIWAYDTFDDSLEFVDATPYPDYVGTGVLEWYGLGDIAFCETIEIIIWMHVVGEHCSNSENIGAADGWSEEAGMFAYDEDSAWIHCVAPDETPPVTTIDIDGTEGDNDWFVSDVTITITATDDQSGVKETNYRIDGGTWTLYTAPFTYGDDGEHTIEAYSEDNAGNVEDPPVSEGFKIDQTDPVTTIDITGTMGDNDWYVGDVTITLTATDDGSGVKETNYRIDGGTWTLYTAPFTYGDDGEHTIEAYSEDNAGNVEDPPVSGDFKIDQTVPTIGLTWDEENSKLVADVDDETSLVAQVEFFVNGESIGTVTEEPYEMEYDASSGDTAYAVVTDNAGNTATSDVIDSYGLSSQSNPMLKAIPIVQQKSL